MCLTFAAHSACHHFHTVPRQNISSNFVGFQGRLPRKRAVTHPRAASAEEYSIPWSLHTKFLKEVLQQQRDELKQMQNTAAVQLQQVQDKTAQHMREIGQLQAQKAQLLQELVSARGEIDVRGAIEIIARIEEKSMPAPDQDQRRGKDQRRGIQTILKWMVTKNKTLQDRIKQVCRIRKLEESRIRNILHNNLYDTVSKNLHGTSHAHLTVCEGKPWSSNDAAAICILFDAMGLQYQYRDRTGMVIPSPYTYI